MRHRTRVSFDIKPKKGSHSSLQKASNRDWWYPRKLDSADCRLKHSLIQLECNAIDYSGEVNLKATGTKVERNCTVGDAFHRPPLDSKFSLWIFNRSSRSRTKLAHACDLASTGHFLRYSISSLYFPSKSLHPRRHPSFLELPHPLFTSAFSLFPLPPFCNS